MTEAESLWHHRDFLRLWSSQAISEIGSVVTFVVLPLTAVVTLHASTLQVGLLAAAGTLPFLVIALPAGVIVDRVRKRRLMVICDLGCMAAIGLVPVAYALGHLTLIQLYATALVTGILTVFFDVSYQSYLPRIVGKPHLMDASGKLSTTQAFAQLIGRGLGGLIFGLLRAGALTIDAVSYLASSIALLLIRDDDSATVSARNEPRRVYPDLVAGLAFVFRNRILRKTVSCTALLNLFGTMTGALQILFMIRVLHIRPADTGYFLALIGAGGIVAGLIYGPLSKLIGSARLIWMSVLVLGFVGLLIPTGGRGWLLGPYAVGLLSIGFRVVLYGSGSRGYVQIICPPELLGRMNAAIRWIIWGTLPLGGLLAGLLGSAVGIRSALWIAAVGSCAASFLVVASPLRTMRDIPVDVPTGAQDTLGKEVTA